jgi:hypothetical protein
MTEPLKPLKPGDTITDPETGEHLKDEKPVDKTWMHKLCRETGITLQEETAPKDFCRVIIPTNNTQDK